MISRADQEILTTSLELFGAAEEGQTLPDTGEHATLRIGVNGAVDPPSGAPIQQIVICVTSVICYQVIILPRLTMGVDS